MPVVLGAPVSPAAISARNGSVIVASPYQPAATGEWISAYDVCTGQLHTQPSMKLATVSTPLADTALWLQPLRVGTGRIALLVATSNSVRLPARR